MPSTTIPPTSEAVEGGPAAMQQQAPALAVCHTGTNATTQQDTVLRVLFRT